ncbi:MAG: PQQ-dependent sugar dehydrogenase [Ectothiorhodospiraceae bacterium]|nr:PQQ-dependent sugar dehydrogenase [Ectothiorhodospiraceae bacterium]
MPMLIRSLVWLLFSVASWLLGVGYASANDSASNGASNNGFPEIALERVFATVSMRKPLALLEAPFVPVATEKFRGTTLPRIWYVVEQAGRVLRLQQFGATLQTSTFVDLGRWVESGPNEAGLLGMALDPQFERNGRVYLSYTKKGSPLISVLSRWHSIDGGRTLEPDSERILLEVAQPYSNHNGGNVQFGSDGYLYWGLGDGGSAGDPKGNGQNTQTLLGSILRLHVTGDVSGEVNHEKTYQIPPDNPFVKEGGKPEIYAYGLRNPWRWSFDRQTGKLWLADVGQNAWEEINIVTRGANYGWNLREGAHCYSDGCKRKGLSEPIAEYSHDDGCSVTGGYVYRGKTFPALYGVYLFADFCSGKIWGLPPTGDGRYQKQLLIKSGLNISSFAEDRAGELYVVDLGGKVFNIVSPQ